MILDNLTFAALLITFILIIVAVALTIHKTRTDKKLYTMAMQFTLIQHNDQAHSYCKHIYSKHPELCLGIDYTLKEDGDCVEIDKWDSYHSRPNRPDSQ